MNNEIRTPLTSVLGYAEPPLEAERPAEEPRGYAEIIQRNGQHLLWMVDDILDLVEARDQDDGARAETGHGRGDLVREVMVTTPAAQPLHHVRVRAWSRGAERGGRATSASSAEAARKC
jgi:signal transduction histidine kinase